MKRGRQIAIPGTLDLTVSASAEDERLLLAMTQAAANREQPFGDESSNTYIAYQRAWVQWCRWCHRVGARAKPPINEDDLTDHLQWLTVEGNAPNTVRLALSALCSIDAFMRATPQEKNPESLRKTRTVRTWLKNWSKQNAKKPQRKAPSITKGELRKVLDLAAQGPGARQAKRAYVARYARDKALLLLGVYGAFRVSELVGLELEHVRSSERGLTITIGSAKTDQAGEGEEVGILPQGEYAVCPVQAFRAWLAVRGDHPGPLFVEIERSGLMGTKALTTRSGNRIVQRLAERADLELVTSHSMRATFVTLAVKKKIPLPLIAEHTRHKSLDTLRGYVRQATLLDDDNPTAGLLEG